MSLSRAEVAPRHQQLIITIFGLYARDPDAAIPVADLIHLVGALGVEATAVRSSVSRLKKRGVLVSTRRDGAAAYAVSPDFAHVFTEGDQRIFQGRRAAFSDPWLLAAFSVPEAKRHLRHQLRVMLTKRGFGSVMPGLWIAPSLVKEAISRELGNAGLLEYVDMFIGTHVGNDRDMPEKVGQWWDLAGIAALYRDFLDATEPTISWLDVTDPGPRDAFCQYIPLLTKWRRLPYRDPGLPLELLPVHWPGERAEKRFRSLHARLEPLAAQHAAEVLGECA